MKEPANRQPKYGVCGFKACFLGGESILDQVIQQECACIYSSSLR